MFRFRNPEKSSMVDPARALPGRDEPMRVPEQHFGNFQPLRGPYPAGLETAIFVAGCFGGGWPRISGGGRHPGDCRWWPRSGSEPRISASG